MQEPDRIPCHYCGVLTVPGREVFEMQAALPEPWTGHEYRERMTALRRVMRVVDHKTPRSQGGTNNRRNRVTACNDCNNRKGTKEYLDFLFATWLDQKEAAS